MYYLPGHIFSVKITLPYLYSEVAGSLSVPNSPLSHTLGPVFDWGVPRDPRVHAVKWGFLARCQVSEIQR